MKNLCTPVLWLYATCIMLSTIPIHAQTNTNTNKQWGITTENDGYALKYKDGYYTNGIFVHFSHIINNSNNKEDIIKKIRKYEFGQQMYTPYNGSYYTKTRIDRPFAGYLYAKATNSFFYTHRNLLELSAAIGVVGKPSLVDITQINFHRLMKGYIPKGWKYQIQTEPTINFGTRYVQSLLPSAYTKFLDIQAIGQMNVGTVFTNASVSVITLIGLLQPLQQSSFLGSRLTNQNTRYNHHGTELFLSIQPIMECQMYNATVQGPLFNKYKGPIVSHIEPLVYQYNIGLHFARPHWGVAMVWTHRTREAVTMRTEQDYGSLQFTFRSHKD